MWHSAKWFTTASFLFPHLLVPGTIEYNTSAASFVFTVPILITVDHSPPLAIKTKTAIKKRCEKGAPKDETKLSRGEMKMTNLLDWPTNVDGQRQMKYPLVEPDPNKEKSVLRHMF
jgi:hypothetical protein